MVEKIEPTKNVNKINKQKLKVVNSICQELDISQKRLSEILEIPERTVNSWAVKNEIPKIAKKALEYYMLNVKNQKIIDSYINSSKLQTTLKSFLKLHKEKA